MRVRKPLCVCVCVDSVFILINVYAVLAYSHEWRRASITHPESSLLPGSESTQGSHVNRCLVSRPVGRKTTVERPAGAAKKHLPQEARCVLVDDSNLALSARSGDAPKPLMKEGLFFAEFPFFRLRGARGRNSCSSTQVCLKCALAVC